MSYVSTPPSAGRVVPRGKAILVSHLLPRTKKMTNVKRSMSNFENLFAAILTKIETLPLLNVGTLCQAPVPKLFYILQRQLTVQGYRPFCWIHSRATSFVFRLLPSTS